MVIHKTILHFVLYCLHLDASPVCGVVPDDDHLELRLQLRPLLRPEHQPHQALVSAVRVSHTLQQCFR